MAGARAILESPFSGFVESVNMMVYGMPGEGKTHLAGTAPNAVIINGEPGIISARNAGFDGGIVNARNWEQMEQTVADAEEGRYAHRDWIVLDTLSTFETKGMRGLLKDEVKKRPQLDPDVPAIQHYLKVQTRIKRLVERLVDLPQNVLVCCHAMRVETPSGGALYLPSIQGGADKGYPVANYCMAMMNVVGFMQTSVTEDGAQVRRTLWQTFYDSDSDIRYTAKDQYQALGRYRDDVTMPEIIKAISAKRSIDSSAKKSGKRR